MFKSKNIKFLLLALVVTLILSLVLIGCSGNEEEQSSSSVNSTSSEKDSKSTNEVNENEDYVMVAYCTSIPYWLDGQRGLQAAAKELGVKASFTGPVEFDAQAQARVVEELVAKGVDGIILSPADPDVLAAPAEKAMAAGIPVVMVISDVNSDKASFGFLGGNNYNVGVTGGTYAAEKLINKKGKVGILTMPGVSVHEQRKQGYVETFEQYPDIEVVSVADTSGDPTVGLEKAAAIIQSNPDLKLLIGTDSVGGAAAARAVVEAGKEGEIDIIGMDRDQDLLSYIKEGVVTATIASKSFSTKWMALHYLYWINHNKMHDAEDWNKAGINPVPLVTDTGNMVIDGENVDLFIKK